MNKHRIVARTLRQPNATFLLWDYQLPLLVARTLRQPSVSSLIWDYQLPLLVVRTPRQPNVTFLLWDYQLLLPAEMTKKYVLPNVRLSVAITSGEDTQTTIVYLTTRVLSRFLCVYAAYKNTIEQEQTVHKLKQSFWDIYIYIYISH